jgi:glutamate dehydrogenase
MPGGRETAALIDEVAALVHDKVEDDRAVQIDAFLRRYYEGVPPRDLQARDVADLYGAAMSHWNLAQQRDPRTPKIRLYTPDLEQHGWRSPHTVIEIVLDDMPFIVDSVSMELSRQDVGIHLAIYPMIDVRRDDAGNLREALQAGETADDARTESFMHVEIDRQTPHALDAIRERLLQVLADVRAAVDDWPAMREQVRHILDGLEADPPPVDPEELAETRRFLAWLDDDHFTFLGCRTYDLERGEDGDVIRSQVATGLGIMRSAPASEKRLAEQPPEIGELARARTLLNLTKANAKATVHRPSYLDYVGVKRFGPDGEVVGEWRVLGLYTSRVYSARPQDIPVVRRKVEAVLDRAGFAPDGHDAKALGAILASYPRDELFEMSSDELFDIAMGILGLQERRQVRLFMRRDRFGRYLSCLVFVPRDRYNTENRLRLQQVLTDAFDATGLEHAVRLSESVLARLHFVVRTRPGQAPSPDVEELERRLAEATRSWADDLSDALVDELGEERGTQLLRAYEDAFPAAYREEHPARRGVADVQRLERLDPEDDLAMRLYRHVEAPPGRLQLKLYRAGDPIALSEVLPLLEHMGFEVTDQRPYEVHRADGPSRWIYDFGLRCDPAAAPETDRAIEVFQEAFARVWAGDSEDDGFNRLVLLADLTWRDVTVLRAYSRYLRQTTTRFSQAYMESALVDNPRVARLLRDLFQARFDPAAHDPPTADALDHEVEEALEAVESLDQDRILRSFLHLIRATLRTSHFQARAADGHASTDGSGPPSLSLKLEPTSIPDLPLPRPAFEIFVYSPAVEGVHLRGGEIARGGLRWSERREDFRTEVLGLMKAQTVKNAVIVPVGAKGGFVVKTPAHAIADLRAEVERCYRVFIRGLLAISDNIVDGELVPPADVVRYDGDDPYLVVAADKGTATFSDTANAIAEEHRFWLGDAFASGGSAGYDHKAMGITARGAWVSVQRHFRELGLDVQTTPFTVVGIGDMSGDVFGNGMLLSDRIRLVGAFDHRHVFLDPDPDPEVSYAERRRLFDLPRSSWDDYRRELISEGGGVWSRSAKAVPLSAEVRHVLDVDAESLTPDELVSALLRAPVGLLFNGGIGTFVKASHETDADVGDKSTDRVRIDATDLRCRVVGEGGNLGLTQRARIEYALGGGLINTDAIDNSAGVDCSDHEVNIKILLGDALRDEDLTRRQRNELLVEMTDEVAELVLRNNAAQVETISNSVANAASMVDVHRRHLQHLEQAGQLDRVLEALPSDEDLQERAANGDGLVRPEFAVLLAYAKTTLEQQLLASDLPEDPWLSRELERYFPSTLQDTYRDRMGSHRLRREIIATQVANALVNDAGTTFVFRLAEETGASAVDITTAHRAAREVFDLHGLRDLIHELDHHVAASVQTRMVLEARRLVERGTRWLLRNHHRPLDIGAIVSLLADGTTTVAGLLPAPLRGAGRQHVETTREQLEDAGVPETLAERVACLPALFSALDLVTVADEVGEDVGSAADTHFALGERLHLDWLREQIGALPRETRWQTLARDALRDEFYTRHRELTAEVLRATDPTEDATDRTEAWIRRNAARIRRCEHMLADIRTSSVPDLAMLSVGLREIRDLLTAAT